MKIGVGLDLLTFQQNNAPAESVIFKLYPQMINNYEDIRNIFNIFHDGDIVEYEKENNDLRLKVQIPYLTDRVKKGFSYFTITLVNCTFIQLETWPNQKDHTPEKFYELNRIFQTTLWILDAEIKKDIIEVSCSQSDMKFDYCGGFLRFTASSAKVIDEAEKEYTIGELGNLSESYWDEWENNNKNKV